MVNDMTAQAIVSMNAKLRAAEVEREQLRELVKRFAGMIDAERAALEVKPNLSVREWDKVRVLAVLRERWRMLLIEAGMEELTR